MGPGACSDISVSLVTCTLGRLGSEEKLEVYGMHPPMFTHTPHVQGLFIPTASGRDPRSTRLYLARLSSSGSSCWISGRLFLPGARYPGTASSSTSSGGGCPPSLSVRRTGVGEAGEQMPPAILGIHL